MGKSSLWQTCVKRLWRRLILVALTRAPDLVIGPDGLAYMHRWWLIPKNPICNVYLHRFLRSDDDRAHHDHPWRWNLSLILAGEYIEHTIAAGGIVHRTKRARGDIKFRLGSAPHRIEVSDQPGFSKCWTLFITGPVCRNWGFHCTEAGWIAHEDFTDAKGTGIGRGCG